jgi:pantothenate kinase
MPLNGGVVRDPLPLPPDLPDLPAGARLLGITGAPGAGKSTLAAVLGAALGTTVVPMDGFHYADVELVRRGLRDRKGAPDTFDAPGYAALLARVRAGEEDVVAPAFERTLEQPLAGAISVPAYGPVVTEGNYLLLDEPGWQEARASIDEIWFCDSEGDVRRSRLVDRHVRFGKTVPGATAWVREVDERNAVLVEATRGRADVVVAAAAVAPMTG